MSNDQYKYYLRDLVPLILEKLQESTGSADFDKGLRLAYYDVLEDFLN